MLETNQTAPDFTSPDQDEQPVKLSQFRGQQNVVLYFYPKDDTPGCTTEANEFTEMADEFAKAGAVVIGVSKDSCEKHRKFIKKHGLKVMLLADTSGEVCELYHTWALKKFMGREYMGILRATFVIDKSGKLRHVDYKVKAKGHAATMLDLVKQLD
ncbi:MAG: thioredoxin-dependent thiol peroxidase [Pseudomonadota bacterium]